MSQPDDPLSRLPKRREQPADRMRAILSAAETDGNLPGKPPVPPEPQPVSAPEAKSTPRAEHPRRKPRERRDGASRFLPRKDKLLPAFWTVASVVSLAVNIILFAVLLSLLNNLSQVTVKIPPVKNLPGDLYRNFELMDRAHIQTVIAVDAQVPINFDLQLDNQTAVTLSQDVTVKGAYVVINTPLIDINAPANVTLPAGTSLPIRLQMTVPVQTMLPIHLDVPVDIALGETGLHQPFEGLREAVKPFYCMMEPNALSVDGLPVCR